MLFIPSFRELFFEQLPEAIERCFGKLIHHFYVMYNPVSITWTRQMSWSVQEIPFECFFCSTNGDNCEDEHVVFDNMLRGVDCMSVNCLK